MLSAINPITKLAACLLWMGESILIFDTRFQVACILVPAIALVVFNRTSPLVLLGLMIPFGLFGFGFLTTTLFFQKESEFALQVVGESVFASSAFSAGITLFLRAIACGMISAFFALTTDPNMAIRSLMISLRLPARIGYSLFAAMQLVPDLAAEAQQMRLARAMRFGRRPRRIPGPLEVFGLLIPLLAFAIRRAGRTAIAMEARGLAPAGPRTVMNAPTFAWCDSIFAAMAAAILGLCALLAVTV
ncbi:energy-coupling factor transporter transmembrane component T family protein [Microvirga rosea]|uniref:energy-coupling factor transporter transmembrane component T family protein n=1 Tax=Microvirga rosea TaxID=2715425 RepID=UPI001D0AC4F5|nr:energy-coupling factor transporter transmembrane component T [Microvirga rosea]MCB8819851.1 energy-coupling factor transporter transmembrane protein EcfT [Microvirga rosea]